MDKSKHKMTPSASERERRAVARVQASQRFVMSQKGANVEFEFDEPSKSKTTKSATTPRRGPTQPRANAEKTGNLQPQLPQILGTPVKSPRKQRTGLYDQHSPVVIAPQPTHRELGLRPRPFPSTTTPRRMTVARGTSTATTTGMQIKNVSTPSGTVAVPKLDFGKLTPTGSNAGVSTTTLQTSPDKTKPRIPAKSYIQSSPTAAVPGTSNATKQYKQLISLEMSDDHGVLDSGSRFNYSPRPIPVKPLVHLSQKKAHSVLGTGYGSPMHLHSKSGTIRTGRLPKHGMEYENPILFREVMTERGPRDRERDRYADHDMLSAREMRQGPVPVSTVNENDIEGEGNGSNSNSSSTIDNDVYPEPNINLNANAPTSQSQVSELDDLLRDIPTDVAPHHLPLDLFELLDMSDSMEKKDQDRVRSRTNTNINMRFRVPAVAKYLHADGSSEWKACHVLGYDTERQQYHIGWDVDEAQAHSQKYAGRLNVRLLSESESSFNTRLEIAQNLRSETEKLVRLVYFWDSQEDDGQLAMPTTLLGRMVARAWGSYESVKHMPLQRVFGISGTESEVEKAMVTGVEKHFMRVQKLIKLAEQAKSEGNHAVIQRLIKAGLLPFGSPSVPGPPRRDEFGITPELHSQNFKETVSTISSRALQSNPRILQFLYAVHIIASERHDLQLFDPVPAPHPIELNRWSAEVEQKMVSGGRNIRVTWPSELIDTMRGILQSGNENDEYMAMGLGLGRDEVNFITDGDDEFTFILPNASASYNTLSHHREPDPYAKWNIPLHVAHRLIQLVALQQEFTLGQILKRTMKDINMMLSRFGDVDHNHNHTVDCDDEFDLVPSTAPVSSVTKGASLRWPTVQPEPTNDYRRDCLDVSPIFVVQVILLNTDPEPTATASTASVVSSSGVDGGSNTYAELCFEPPLEHFHEQLMQVFDDAVSMCSGVCRIDGIMLADPDLEQRELVCPVSDEYIAKCRDRLNSSVIRAFAGPQLFQRRLLDTYGALIDQHENRADYVATFADSNPSLGDYRREIQMHQTRSSRIQENLPSKVEMGAFSVDLRPVRNTLATMSRQLSDELLKKVHDIALSEREATEELYRSIMEKLTNTPQSPEEWRDISGYVNNIDEVSCDLREKIDAMMAKYDLLSDFFHDIGSKESEEKYITLSWPPSVLARSKKTEAVLEQARSDFEAILIRQIADLRRTLERAQADVKTFEGFGDTAHSDEYLASTTAVKTELEDSQNLAGKCNEREAIFSIEKTDFSDLDAVAKRLEPLARLWRIAADWAAWYNEWYFGTFSVLNAKTMSESVDLCIKDLTLLKEQLILLEGPSEAAKSVLDEVVEFKKLMPLVRALRNSGMRLRHWKRVGKITGMPIDDVEIEFTVTLNGLVENHHMMDHLEAIDRISDLATSELEIEKQLDKMQAEWQAMLLSTELYQETKAYILQRPDAAMRLIEDQLVAIQGLMQSKYVTPHLDRMSLWERKLARTQDVLDEWLRCQRGWTHLQPIFAANDLINVRPNEARRFAGVDRKWREIMLVAVRTPKALVATSTPKLLETLRDSNRIIDEVRDGLATWLDKKRLEMPRLFFLSNDELYSILFLSTGDHVGITSFLQKLFPGVASLSIDNGKITRLEDTAGESLSLTQPISLGKSAEVWLADLEKSMRSSVSAAIQAALAQWSEPGSRDHGYGRVGAGGGEWKTMKKRLLLSWPSQISSLVHAIGLNEEVSDALEDKDKDKRTEKLNNVMRRVTDLINKCSALLTVRLSDDALSVKEKEIDTLPMRTGSLKVDSLSVGSDGESEDEDKDKDTHVKFSAGTSSGHHQGSGSGGLKPRLSSAKSVQDMRSIMMKVRAATSWAKGLSAANVTDDDESGNASNQAADEASGRLRRTFSLSNLSKDDWAEARSPAHRHTIKAIVAWLVVFREVLQGVCSAESQYHTAASSGGGGGAGGGGGGSGDLAGPTAIIVAQQAEWLRQPRYIIEQVGPEKRVRIQQLGTKIDYGYEFLSAAVPSLFGSTLFSAIDSLGHHRGILFTDPNSDKINEARYVSTALGRPCIVFSCGPNLTAPSLSRLIRGAVASGAFLLLENIDQASKSTLSIIAGDIAHVQRSLERRRGECHLGNVTVALNSGSAIIATLSGASATGEKSNIPTNLRVLFRPIGLSSPVTPSTLDSSLRIRGLLSLPSSEEQAAVAAATGASTPGLGSSVGLTSQKSISRLSSAAASTRSSTSISMADSSHSHMSTDGKNKNASLTAPATPFVRNLWWLLNNAYECAGHRITMSQLSVALDIVESHLLKVHSGSDKSEYSDPEVLFTEALDIVWGAPSPDIERSRKQLLRDSGLAEAMKKSVKRGGRLSLVDMDGETRRKKSNVAVAVDMCSADDLEVLENALFDEVCTKLNLKADTGENVEAIDIDMDSGAATTTSSNLLLREELRPWLKLGLDMYRVFESGRPCILVGPTGSGKSMILKCLASAITKLSTTTTNSTTKWRNIDVSVLYPDAAGYALTFGAVGESGHIGNSNGDDHSDGLLVRTVKSYKAEQSNSESSELWMVFDGSSSGYWLDSLPSIIAEKHVYSSNGETISLPRHSQLIIETDTLCEVSPHILSQFTVVSFMPDFCIDDNLWIVEDEYETETETLGEEEEEKEEQDVDKWTQWKFVYKCVAMNWLEKIKVEKLPLDVAHRIINLFAVALPDTINMIRRSNPVDYKRIYDCLISPGVVMRSFFDLVYGILSTDSSTGAVSVELCDGLFVVAWAWAFGGPLDSLYRSQLDAYFHTVSKRWGLKMILPTHGTIFEYKFESSHGVLRPWTDILVEIEESGSGLDVNVKGKETEKEEKDQDGDGRGTPESTTSMSLSISSSREKEKEKEKEKDSKAIQNQYFLTDTTLAHAYIMKMMIEAGRHVLMSGTACSGKSVLAKSLIDQFGKPYSSMSLSFTCQTSSLSLRLFCERFLERRRKGVYAPPLGSKMIVVCDDLNRYPTKRHIQIRRGDSVELIRQLHDQGGWHDSSLAFRGILDVSLLATTLGNDNVGGGGIGNGQTQLSKRIGRHFAKIAVPALEKWALQQSVVKLISTAANEANVNSSLKIKIKEKAEVLAEATMLLKQEISERYSESDAPIRFNLHDVFSVARGLVLGLKKLGDSDVDGEGRGDNVNIGKLWLNEVLGAQRDVDEVKDMCLDIAATSLGFDLVENNDNDNGNELPIYTVFGKSYEEVESVEAANRKLLVHLNGNHKPSASASNSINIGSLPRIPSTTRFIARMSRGINIDSGLLVVGTEGDSRDLLVDLCGGACGYQVLQRSVAEKDRSKDDKESGSVSVSVNGEESSWRSDLRRSMIAAGIEGKQVMLVLNEDDLSEICNVKENSNEDGHCQMNLNMNLNLNQIGGQNVNDKIDWKSQLVKMDRNPIDSDNLTELINVVNAGDAETLWTPEVRQSSMNALRSMMRKMGISDTVINTHNEFCQRIKSNLRVVISVTESDTLRQCLEVCPALVDYFETVYCPPASEADLMQYASQELANVDLSSGAFRECIVEVLVALHMTAVEACKFESQYAVRGIGSNACDIMAMSVSEMSFIEFVQLFKTWLDKWRLEHGVRLGSIEQAGDSADRLRELIDAAKLELRSVDPSLRAASDRVEEIVKTIAQQRFEEDALNSRVSLQEQALVQMQREAADTMDLIQQTVGIAEKEVSDGAAALRGVSRKDVERERTVANPNGKQQYAMQCMFLLRGLSVRKDLWSEAKSLMGNRDFVKALLHVDTTELNPTVWAQLCELTSNYVNSASSSTRHTISSKQERKERASAAIVAYVMALVKLYQAKQDCEPKYQALEENQAQIIEEQETLESLREQLKNIQEQISVESVKHKEAVDLRNELGLQTTNCEKRIERSNHLLRILKDDLARWKEKTDVRTTEFLELTGISMFSAACVSYLGSFNYNTQERLLESWESILQRYEVPMPSPTANSNSNADSGSGSDYLVLPGNVELANCIARGLPHTSYARRMAACLKFSYRWPLILDADGLGSKLLKYVVEDDTEAYTVVKLDLEDTGFMSKLTNCVVEGHCAVIHIDEGNIEALPHSMSLLIRSGILARERKMIRIGDHNVDLHNRFRLCVLATSHGRTLPSSVFSLFNVIDMTVNGSSQQQVSDLVFESIAQKEKDGALHGVVVHTTRTHASLELRIDEVEQAVVATLNSGLGGDMTEIAKLMSDNAFVEKITDTKKKIGELRSSLRDNDIKGGTAKESLQALGVIAQRGAALFSALWDLPAIVPGARFSLSWFLSVAVQAVATAMQADTAKRRAEMIWEDIIKMVHQAANRSVPEHSMSAFLLLVCARLLQNTPGSDGGASEEDVAFLLGRPPPPPPPSAENEGEREYDQNPYDWLTDDAWARLVSLSWLPTFNGILSAIASAPDKWKEVVTKAHVGSGSEALLFPSGWSDGRLTRFQELLLWSCLCPSRVPTMTRSLAKELIGTAITKPTETDVGSQLYSSLRASAPLVPVLVLCGPTVDAHGGILNLAENQGMEQNVVHKSVGTGTGEDVLAAIDNAIDRGKWVIVENPHLEIGLLERIRYVVAHIPPMRVNSDFRVWICVPEEVGSLLPDPLIRRCIVTSLSTPDSIRTEMIHLLSLYRSAIDSIAPDSPYRRLAFAMLFCSAVVNQRQRYGRLGVTCLGTPVPAVRDWDCSSMISALSDLVSSHGGMGERGGERQRCFERFPVRALTMVAQSILGCGFLCSWDRTMVSGVLDNVKWVQLVGLPPAKGGQGSQGGGASSGGMGQRRASLARASRRRLSIAGSGSTAAAGPDAPESIAVIRLLEEGGSPVSTLPSASMPVPIAPSPKMSRFGHVQSPMTTAGGLGPLAGKMSVPRASAISHAHAQPQTVDYGIPEISTVKVFQNYARDQLPISDRPSVLGLPESAAILRACNLGVATVRRVSRVYGAPATQELWESDVSHHLDAIEDLLEHSRSIEDIWDIVHSSSTQAQGSVVTASIETSNIALVEGVRAVEALLAVRNDLYTVLMGRDPRYCDVVAAVMSDSVPWSWHRYGVRSGGGVWRLSQSISDLVDRCKAAIEWASRTKSFKLPERIDITKMIAPHLIEKTLIRRASVRRGVPPSMLKSVLVPIPVSTSQSHEVSASASSMSMSTASPGETVVLSGLCLESADCDERSRLADRSIAKQSTEMPIRMEIIGRDDPSPQHIGHSHLYLTPVFASSDKTDFIGNVELTTIVSSSVWVRRGVVVVPLEAPHAVGDTC